MPDKLDLTKQLKDLYFPSPKAPVMVDIPVLNFLMIDGHGDPNTSPEYQAAVEALYSLSYTLKFAIKKAETIDYAVMPLEGLWWVEDMNLFTTADKSAWDWTMMIAQPEPVTAAWVERSRTEAIKKKGPGETAQAIARIRFEPYAEGRAAQIMHLGPYSAEGPTVARLHDFIVQQGCQRCGKHHEIYLGDPRRTAPEKLKTVIRQPVG
jgi:hypothetical protein